MVTMLLNTELDFYVIDLQISKSRSLCQKLDVCNNEAIHNTSKSIRAICYISCKICNQNVHNSYPIIALCK